MIALSVRHRVALAYLRAGDEHSVDQDLARHCEFVIEGRRSGSSASSVRPLTPTGALALSSRLLAGQPLWAAGRWAAPFAARVRAAVATWRPDVVQAEFSAMGQYLTAEMRRASRLVVTFHEPAAEAAGERVAAGGIASLFWHLEAGRWRRFETRLLDRIDAAVAFTPRDADVLRGLQRHRHRAPRSLRHRGDPSPPTVEAVPIGVPITIIPLGVTLPDVTPAPREGPPRLVFVGNFVHAPNVDAARHLIEEIFPPLRRRFGSLELWLVGPNAPARLTSLATDGVTFTGHVPDVGALLARASVVVAPLRSGGGMRVKVLEAMAAGRAIVATPLAVEGIQVTDGRELLVAGDAHSFRRCVAELLTDPARRSALGRAARDLVARHHSWAGVAAAYESMHDRIIDSSRRRDSSSHDRPSHD